MSKYTTGELAALCGVSVRTVQYYDKRSILTPSALSEGGRRLYSEDDLKKLRVICFLRDMDFSIDGIGRLLSDNDPEQVMEMLIAEQEQRLSAELSERRDKLERLLEMRRELRGMGDCSLEALADIEHLVRNQKKRRRLLISMLIVGTVADIIELGTLAYAIKTEIWWPFFIGLGIAIMLCVLISALYFTRSRYICRHCHTCFKPTLRESLFAAHTPNTRRLRCPSCGERSFCLETYADDE